MRECRRSTLVSVAIYLAILFVQCQPDTSKQPLPSPTRSMKGYELYSRQVDGVWYFSLLAGTNRLKTYAEISSPEVQVRGLDTLKLVLDRLAESEQLFWSASRVPNTSFPPAELIGEIREYCGQRGLDLQLDPLTESPAPVATPLAAASAPASNATPNPTPTPTANPAPPSGPKPTPPFGGWSRYENPVFAVALEYPAHWQAEAGHSAPEVGDTKYAGDDGFFIIGAMNGLDLDTVTTSVANHKLQPYGTAPSIENLTIQGQPARLILPSEDQSPGMEGQAEMIIQYPEPVSVSRYAYHYLTLAADREHILPIARTLQFTEVSVAPTIEVPATPAPAEEAAEVLQPEILFFEVSPSDRLNFGDSVTVQWSARDAMHLIFC